MSDWLMAGDTNNTDNVDDTREYGIEAFAKVISDHRVKIRLERGLCAQHGCCD